MRRVEIADDLAEAALLAWMDLAESRGDTDSDSFRRWRDRAYALPAGAQREHAFRHQVDHWAGRLEFAGPFERALKLCPHVQQAVERVHVRRALRRKDEGSELWRDLATGKSRLSIHVLPSRFLDLEAMRFWVAVEMLRAEQMLDPAFGYQPSLSAEIESMPARAEAVRTRLTALWKTELESLARQLLGADGTMARPASDWPALMQRAVEIRTAAQPARP